MRTTLVGIAALVCLAGAALGAEERWSILEMDGRRVGWVRTAERPGEGGDLRTESEMRLAFARGAAKVEMSMESVFVETAGGEPRFMVATQQLGGVPVVARYEFGPDAVTITTEQSGQTSTSKAQLPQGEWMTPAEASRFVESRIESGAREFTVRTLDPLVGLMPVEASYRIDGPTTVEAFGKTVPAIKWLVTPSFPPGAQSVEWVSEKGEPIRSEISMGAIRMSVLAAEKELALAPFEPAEIMASTLVEPAGAPIENPRALRRASYVLSIDGELPDMPTHSAQRFERIDAGRARVVVDAANVGAASDEDVQAPSSRNASPAIDSADPVIRELTERALREADAADKPAAAKSEALRRFVHGHLSRKSLSVGFATASEAARAREGDCTEHGMLLAAMLRAAGIPSRVVSGLVYMDEFLGQGRVFGYHMWTQALVEQDGEKRWIDLDATLDPERPFDATHIAISTSAMKPGETLNSMVGLAPLLGRLEIEVERAE